MDEVARIKKKYEQRIKKCVYQKKQTSLITERDTEMKKVTQENIPISNEEITKI